MAGKTITTDDIKRVLRKTRQTDTRIKLLEESQEKAFARVTSATQRLSETGVHGGPDKNALAEYVALSEEIVEELTKLYRVKQNVMKLIFKVRKHDLQSVLQLYYLDGLTWEEVAVKMHFSWRWTMELHGRALQEMVTVAKRNPVLWRSCK